MQTNYIGHDKAYRQLRAEGSVGWDKTEEGYQEQKQTISKRIESGNAPRAGRLLELGCGAGNISIWLARQGYDVTGIDISPAAIDWARCKAMDEGARAEFVLGDVLDLKDFEDESFDFVLDGHCLHCIIGEDRPQFLHEAYRVLKPGGYFLVDTMCGPVKAEMVQGYDTISKCTVFDGIATRFFGWPDEIQAELESAGFRIVSSCRESETGHQNLTIEAMKEDTRQAHPAERDRAR